MPDSDVPLPNARFFWRALLASGALILAMCAFNAAMDPTGQVGWAKTHALNRTLPASAVSFVRNSDSVTAYQRTIAATSANTFLIGTSREARGFDLCDRPNMLRIAGSSWGIREISQISARILETRTTPATLLIELGVPGDPGTAAESFGRAAAYAALSPRTTLLSLETAAANIWGSDEMAAREIGCRPLASESEGWLAAARQFEYISGRSSTINASRQRGRTILVEMVGQANRICAKTGIRHTIVYFALPGTPDVPLTRGFRAALQDAQREPRKMLQALSEHGACRFRYLDFLATPPGSAAEQQLWRDRDQWMDYTHFSPRLGNVAINAILQ